MAEIPNGKTAQGQHDGTENPELKCDYDLDLLEGVEFRFPRETGSDSLTDEEVVLS